MNDLLNDFLRDTFLHKDYMGFNEPTHLPKPSKGPFLEPEDFDVFNDRQMKECIGGGLAAPVQALLVSYEQFKNMSSITDADKAKFFDSLMGELKELRHATKEEFNNL